MFFFFALGRQDVTEMCICFRVTGLFTVHHNVYLLRADFCCTASFFPVKVKVFVTLTFFFCFHQWAPVLWWCIMNELDCFIHNTCRRPHCQNFLRFPPPFWIKCMFINQDVTTPPGDHPNYIFLQVSSMVRKPKMLAT